MSKQVNFEALYFEAIEIIEGMVTEEYYDSGPCFDSDQCREHDHTEWCRKAKQVLQKGRVLKEVLTDV